MSTISLYNIISRRACFWFFGIMQSDRLVVQKYFQRGLSGGQIFQHVKQLGITRNCVYRNIRRLRDTGSIQDRSRSDWPRTCRTKERIKRVREKIRRNPQRSATNWHWKKVSMIDRCDEYCKSISGLKHTKNVNYMDYQQSRWWLGSKDAKHCWSGTIPTMFKKLFFRMRSYS